MTVHRISLDKLPLLLDQLEPEIRGAVIRGMKSAALRSKAEVVEQIDKALPFPAVDTGGLRQSVSVTLFPNGGWVTVDAPHASHIEFGTRPFTPPLGPLLTWVIRKGLAADEDEAYAIARAVQRKIQREGIAPRHYFAKAMQVVQEKFVPQEIRHELNRLEENGIV